MIEALRTTLLSHPAEGLCFVFLLAWLEYVFPPVPGDSTMLLACFLAGTGALPKLPTYGACLLGSVLGAFTAYAVGLRLGRSYFFLRSEWAAGELRKFERGLERFGARLLAVNRFVPGVRGVFLYGAGIGRVPLRQVAIYSSLSNCLWVALLAWGGTRLGSSWEEVQRVFSRYALGIGAVLAVYFVIGYARARRRARAARALQQAPPPERRVAP
jgi:membrane protein DedA with SNARE-associated domain